jgi:hypothetical protein
MAEDLYIVDDDFIQAGSILYENKCQLFTAMNDLYNSLKCLCEHEKGNWVEAIKANILPQLSTLTETFSQQSVNFQTDCVSFLDAVDTTDATLYGG